MSGGRRWLAALVLFALAFSLILLAQRAHGVARDETVYMGAGSKYADWWLGVVGGTIAVDHQTITGHFGGKGATDNNREHPPLMKTLFGLSERLFHDGLGWCGELTAYRLPSAAVAALLVVLVFFFTQAIWGAATGVIAALLVLFLPRLFFHAGLACFDAPIATFWFATIYAWWRSLACRGWMWSVGAIFGLALATKHNALLLPAVIGPHYLWLAFRWQRGLGRRGWRALGVGLVTRRPIAVGSLALLGPLVLLGLWPWLWFDPLPHLGDWIRFHLDHVHYNFEYLGENWNHPRFPWHVPIVTTFVTVPAATLLASLVGTAVWVADARGGRAPDAERAPGLLLALSAAVAMGPFLLGSTPIFGAEKHWATAMPSLAIAAAVGAVWAARLAGQAVVEAWPALSAPRTQAVATLLVATGLVAAAALETWNSEPYGLTHYNAIAGGAPGGADLGMNRQFWGVSVAGVLPVLVDKAPPAGQKPVLVYTHDASPAWGVYQRLGAIPTTLRDAGSEYSGGITRSDWALVIHERHFLRHDYLVWSAYQTVQPTFVLRSDGVPIVSVYQRPPPKS